MATKTMSVVEEVYWYIREHPEVESFTSKKIQSGLSWLDICHVSTVLTLFRKERRLELIGLVQPRNVYKRTELFNSKRRFCSGKKFANRNIKPGIQRFRDRSKLPQMDENGVLVEANDTTRNRNILAKKLYDLAERQLEIATELEELRAVIMKFNLIL